jgi:thiol:disulfide interchange protein DsbD
MLRSLIVLALLPLAAPAQTSFSEVGTITASVNPAKAKPGEVVTVTFSVEPIVGWHTYPIAPKTKQTSVTDIKTANDVIIAVTKPSDPPGVVLKDSVDRKGEKDEIYEAPAAWVFKAVVHPKAKKGKQPIRFDESSVMVCHENCFNAKPADFPVVELEVLDGTAEPPAEYAAIVSAAVGPKTPVPPVTPVLPSKPNSTLAEHRGLVKKDGLPVVDYRAKLDVLAESLVKGDSVQPEAARGGLGGLLAAAVFWGFVSLVTPCVFPMIPITVSLFLKKSDNSPKAALKFAAIYSLTITLVLGISAVALLSLFRKWSVSAEMNLALGMLFVVFALSLFGWFDIALPNFLLRGAERRRQAGGLLGTVFGAIAFSIVSFTCVAPFLGGFAGLAATGNFSTFELTLAGLTFAAAFASPFFLLALFPTLLKKLPRSGGWLDKVKAVMGFLELAAAFKFLRTAELVGSPPADYFTYDVVLAAWVAIFAACGFYLLNAFRLPHDDDERAKVSVPQLCIALLCLGFSMYLAPALFRGGDGKPQRPTGVVFAWVDAFLLPDGTSDLSWTADLHQALDEARKERLSTGQSKFVFVDFTGVSCTNCRYNESNVFPMPGVQAELKKHRLVQLYTDHVPAEFYANPPSLDDRKAEGLANTQFQRKAFGTEQLPLYVMLEPLASGKVRVAGVYSEGKINTTAAFQQFVTK